MNHLDQVKTIAKVVLSSQRSELTLEGIKRAVARACMVIAPEVLSESERGALVRELEANYQTVIGESRTLVGEDEGWSVWLPERRGSLSWGVLEPLRRTACTWPDERRCEAPSRLLDR